MSDDPINQYVRLHQRLSELVAPLGLELISFIIVPPKVMGGETVVQAVFALADIVDPEQEKFDDEFARLISDETKLDTKRKTDSRRESAVEKMDRILREGGDLLGDDS